MKLSLKNSNVNDIYDLINDKTLSFKDKVLMFTDYLQAEDLNKKHDLEISNEEVILFKNRLNKAKVNKEKILIISDYDCDGILSLVIMTRLLDYLAIDYNYIIPSRIKDGYGINNTFVEMAKKYEFDLIMTLDNGVVAFDALNLAAKLNIDVLIVDHHEYEIRPNCYALIHPFNLDDGFYGLCTGGLAYLISKLYYEDKYSNILAMITTLADVCPVLNVNRQILIDGLKELNNNPDIYLPIKNLLAKKQYSYDDISFNLIPKINAISRMDHLTNVNILVKYFKDLISDNKDTALQIDKINNQRKEESQKMISKAKESLKGEKFEIIYHQDFIEGLCGLVAGSITNDINRPVIILSKGKNCLKGSGRASDGFNIFEYFSDFKDNFIAYGGHAKAIGLSIDESKINDLKEYVKNHELVLKANKEKIIKVDINELTNENISFIESLKPYGEGYKEPIFYIDNINIKSKYIIKGLYPKYTLNNNIEAITFNKALDLDNFKAIIGKVGINSYGKRINIRIIDLVV